MLEWVVFVGYHWSSPRRLHKTLLALLYISWPFPNRFIIILLLGLFTHIISNTKDSNVQREQIDCTYVYHVSMKSESGRCFHCFHPLPVALSKHASHYCVPGVSWMSVVISSITFCFSSLAMAGDRWETFEWVVASEERIGYSAVLGISSPLIQWNASNRLDVVHGSANWPTTISISTME